MRCDIARDMNSKVVDIHQRGFWLFFYYYYFSTMSTKKTKPATSKSSSLEIVLCLNVEQF